MSSNCSQLAFYRKITKLVRLSDNDDKEQFCCNFINFTRLISQVKDTNPNIRYSINPVNWSKIKNYLDKLLPSVLNLSGQNDFYTAYKFFISLKYKLKYRRSFKNNPLFYKLKELRAGRLKSASCDIHKSIFKTHSQLYDHLEKFHR